MTFKELFEKAMSQVDMTGKYEGRHDAIYAFNEQLETLVKELVAESEWDRVYIGTPYLRGANPQIRLYYLNASAEIDFKIKLKKNGTRHSYYGDSTYYLPSVAFTCDESLMDQDVAEYFDLLFNVSDEVKKAIADVETKKQVLADNADIIKSYTDIVNKFNTLPLEIRDQLRCAGLPTLCFW